MNSNRFITRVLDAASPSSDGAVTFSLRQPHCRAGRARASTEWACEDQPRQDPKRGTANCDDQFVRACRLNRHAASLLDDLSSIATPPHRTEAFGCQLLIRRCRGHSRRLALIPAKAVVGLPAVTSSQVAVPHLGKPVAVMPLSGNCYPMTFRLLTSSRGTVVLPPIWVS
jgi:hypothetical protein